MKPTRLFAHTLCLSALLALSILPAAVRAQAPARPAAPQAIAPGEMTLTPDTRKAVLETVWGRVNTRYYDPTFGGVDWKAVHDKYAPRALPAQSDRAYYSLLQQMLGELKRSHFAIIPPDQYTLEDGAAALAQTKTTPTTVPTKPAVPTAPLAPTTTPTSPVTAPAAPVKTTPAVVPAPNNPQPVVPAAVPQAPVSPIGARDGSAGFEIRLVENVPTVWKVDKGSGAETAGLKPGYVVTKIQNIPLGPIVEQIGKIVKDPGEAAVAVRHGLASALVGPIGSPVSVEVLDANNAPQTLIVPRAALQGIPTKFGELPTQYVQTESRILPGNIGYVHFNIFLVPILVPVRAAIAQMRAQNVSGLVLDLRNNPGGLGALANAISGSLFSSRTDLGAMTLRTGVARFPVFPIDEPYTGPLVILTDEGSASTSEIMAGSLQELGRATVVGQKTAGAVLPSAIETLPGTRARLQYAFADFKTPKGTLLEGRGVLPDIPVQVTRRALLDGHDPELDAAINVIKDKAAPKPTKSSVKAGQIVP